MCELVGLQPGVVLASSTVVINDVIAQGNTAFKGKTPAHELYHLSPSSTGSACD